MPEHAVDTIHVVFKTHLDLGYTDLANAVYRRYMDDFIPGALRLAQQMRKRDGEARFVWTTGSWLIDQFLEHSAPGERRRMEAAIEAGDIVWHALPFTTHTELMSAELFRFGLSIARRLDARFGRTTIAAKMTDVPGHTRGIVPLLAEAGVKLLHLGLNEGASVPEVPSVFVWRDEASGRDLLMIYKGQYGGLVRVDGLPDALLVRMTSDNIGPPTPEAVQATFDELRQQFPGARVIPSTLDAFAAALEPARGRLPVLTSEIGDTWIHGVAADPQKVRALRALLRLQPAIAADERLPEAAKFAFQNGLLCVTEHTWGMDIKVHLRDYSAWTAAEFAAARGGAPWQLVESSWAEQRAYLHAAVRALEGTRWHAEAARALEPPPALTEPSAEATQERQFSNAQFELGIDGETGAITHLQTRADGQVWATAEHPLALFRYETFDDASYEQFWDEYIRNRDRAEVMDWAQFDYGKPGIAGKTRRIEPAPARLEALYAVHTPDALVLTAALKPPTEWATLYGAPPVLHLELTLHKQTPAIGVRLAWDDKPACRLPEAGWLSFVPNAPGAAWQFEKLGQWIDPRDVVRGGNRSLHAVFDRVVCVDGARQLTITTRDAALAAPGAPALLRFTKALPEMEGGVHFNLFNNLWGTNFPMWNGGAAEFAFTLQWSWSDETP
jgi:hypothetical protein